MENKKMKVLQVQKLEGGEHHVTLALTPDQVAYLLNVGMSFLMQTGALEVETITEEEYKAAQGAATLENPSEEQNAAQKAFLEAVDIDTIPKA